MRYRPALLQADIFRNPDCCKDYGKRNRRDAKLINELSNVLEGIPENAKLGPPIKTGYAGRNGGAAVWQIYGQDVDDLKY